MTSEITIESAHGTYLVRIGDGLLAEVLASRPNDPVVVDSAVVDQVGDPARHVTLEAREDHKTLGGAERLISALRDRGAGRGDALIAVGGGIVQDVATLTASLYMRGVEWRYAPTTMLAMVDSCVGGKSSINVGPYKNLAGNFYPPAEIVIDPAFIATLRAGDRAGGLCEAMKISFCRGPDSFLRYLELVSDLKDDGTGAAPVIDHALRAKKWFIEVDEFDQAERRQLNFGHTFAHALEAATGFAVGHGTAVGIGVVAAERLAVTLDGDAAAQPELVAEATRLVRVESGLGARLDGYDKERFRSAFLADKKHGADGLHVILPLPGGGTAERVLALGPDSEGLVLAALDAAIAEVTR